MGCIRAPSEFLRASVYFFRGGIMRLSLTLCLLGSYVAAAGSSLQSTEIYGEWSSPINVGPPVNTEYNDNYAILSRDELTMYFTSDRLGGVGGDDLWFTTRASLEDPWGDPENMSALNSTVADSLAVLSSDEHVMFFHSTRTGGCGAGDIWMTRRHNRRSQEWGPPVNLGCVVNTGATEIAPAFFENPETGQVTLFYGSNRPGSQVFDVYASVVGEDGYFGPGALVPEFSSPGRDTRIFIRKDGLEVFITSDRTGGQGLIDIWTSTRETLSDPWPTPIDVPSPVNSGCDDGSPWLSRDGTTLYFFSSRAVGTECGKRDIWYTTRVKIAQENTTQAPVASFWKRTLAHLALTSH
jgi:WD40-like Beta Propeller Repeat